MNIVSTVKSMWNNLDPKNARTAKIVIGVVAVLLIPGILITFFSSLFSILSSGGKEFPYGMVVVFILVGFVLYRARKTIVRFLAGKVKEYTSEDTTQEPKGDHGQPKAEQTRPKPRGTGYDY